MKIKDSHNRPSSLGKTSSSKGASAGKKVATAGGSQETKKKEAVSVSLSEQLTIGAAGDSAKRADRVAELKLEVESGNYEVDSEKTADKLIDSLTDYSLA